MTENDIASLKRTLERNRDSLNNRDIDAYLNNQSPDVDFMMPGGLTMHGRDQIRGFVEAFWKAFPDGQITFGRQTFSDGLAATEVVFTGTHTGPLPTPNGPLPATGKKVELHSMSILSIKDEQITSERGYGDPMEMPTQLGLTAGAGS
jgi:steroid delta-isomerase-like uncharacterized protein